MLKLLLKRAAFTQIRHTPSMIDVSADSQAHQPFLWRLVRTLAERDELETLSEQMRALVNQEDFCAYWPLMTFLGHKSDAE